MGRTLISTEDEVFGIYHDVIEYVSSAKRLDDHVKNAKKLAKEKLNRDISLIIMNESLLNEYLLYIKREHIPFTRQEPGQGFRVNAGSTMIAGLPVLVSPSVGGVNFMAGPDIFSFEMIQHYKESPHDIHIKGNKYVHDEMIVSLRQEIVELEIKNADLVRAYEKTHSLLVSALVKCDQQQDLIATLNAQLDRQPKSLWDWLFGRRK